MLFLGTLLYQLLLCLPLVHQLTGSWPSWAKTPDRSPSPLSPPASQAAFVWLERQGRGLQARSQRPLPAEGLTEGRAKANRPLTAGASARRRGSRWLWTPKAIGRRPGRRRAGWQCAPRGTWSRSGPGVSPPQAQPSWEPWPAKRVSEGALSESLPDSPDFLSLNRYWAGRRQTGETMSAT